MVILLHRPGEQAASSESPKGGTSVESSSYGSQPTRRYKGKTLEVSGPPMVITFQDDGDEVVNDAGCTAISTKVSGHRE